jgi:hypothetical protein
VRISGKFAKGKESLQEYESTDLQGGFGVLELACLVAEISKSETSKADLTAPVSNSDPSLVTWRLVVIEYSLLRFCRL